LELCILSAVKACFDVFLARHSSQTKIMPLFSRIRSGLYFVALLCVFSASFFPEVAAQPPPMGYNSYGCCGVNGAREEWLRKAYLYLETYGFKKAGYNYLNMDDGWAVGRNPDGTVQVGTNQFPNGLKPFIDEVHARGFKFGLYTTYGPITCGFFEGSEGHLEIDARTYAEWGVDYVKLEGCTGEYFIPDWNGGRRRAVETFAKALKDSGRKIFLNLTVFEFPGFSPWMLPLADSWRDTGDWKDGSWSDILHHMDAAITTPEYVGPGRYSDPDIIYKTYDPNTLKAHFGMYCILSYPLLLGGLFNQPWEIQILTNAEAIAVNQDPAVIQAAMISKQGTAEIYAKPLTSSTGLVRAVAILNRSTNVPVTVNFKWSEIGLPSGPATIRDIWQQTYCAISNDSFTVTVPTNMALFYKITPGVTRPINPGTNYLSDLNWLGGTFNNFTTNGVSVPEQGFPIIRDKNTASVWNPAASALKINGKTYKKGLGLFAHSHVEFFLGGIVRAFHAELGPDDVGFSGAPEIQFVIKADGRIVHDSGVMRFGSAAKVIDLNLTGVGVLTIDVINRRADQSFAAGFADVADAYFVVDEPFSLTSWGITNKQGSLKWQSANGGTYSVEASSNLLNWAPLATNLLSGGTTMQLSVPTVSTQGFFRVTRQR
jgi:alpha-galactosidase